MEFCYRCSSLDPVSPPTQEMPFQSNALGLNTDYRFDLQAVPVGFGVENGQVAALASLSGKEQAPFLPNTGILMHSVLKRA